MAYSLKNHKDGATECTLKDVENTIETLVGQVRFQHPKDQVHLFARIQHALETLQKEYDTQCAEKCWKDPLQIPGVLARVLSHLPVPDLLSCRLVNQYWSEESLSVLNKKCATKLISDEEEEGVDYGFAKHCFESFQAVFDPENQKLPFGKLNFGSSITPPFKRYMLDEEPTKDDMVNYSSFEEVIDDSFSDLLRTFGNHIKDLNLTLNEPVVCAGAINTMLSYTSNLNSLHLPFTLYPETEEVARDALSNLKRLDLNNGIGSTKFLWSLLRSAVNLEEIKFYTCEDSEEMKLKVTVLDQFLRIPPPPVRQNILTNLQTLSLVADYFPPEFNLFPRLAKMQLQLKTFKYEEVDQTFSNYQVQMFLSSISVTLIHLEFVCDSIGDVVSTIVPLNIKTFVADFDIFSLDFLEKYEVLEALEIQGSVLQGTKSINRRCQEKLRSLTVKNFPCGKEKVFAEIANFFPNLASLQISCWGGYLQIVSECFKNLEELVLLQKVRYMPDMPDDSDSDIVEDDLSLGEFNNNFDADDFFSEPANIRSDAAEGMPQASAWIGNLKKLHTLRLDRIHCISADAIVRGLTKCPSVKVLSLQDTKITDEALVAIADSLNPVQVNVKHCRGLTYSVPYFQLRHPFCYLEY